MVVSEGEHYSLFIFCRDEVAAVNVIDDEGSGGKCSSISVTGVPREQQGKDGGSVLNQV